MDVPTSMPRLKGFRYPRGIIAYAVWTYHRFALSTADVEDLSAVRGLITSREAVRQWVDRFGRHFADCIRRDRPTPNDKWHLDEVVKTVGGKKHLLWRAIDANGGALVRRLAHDAPSYSGVEASGKPGAVRLLAHESFGG